jgi:hypothetical protein
MRKMTKRKDMQILRDLVIVTIRKQEVHAVGK